MKQIASTSRVWVRVEWDQRVVNLGVCLGHEYFHMEEDQEWEVSFSPKVIINILHSGSGKLSNLPMDIELVSEELNF